MHPMNIVICSDYDIAGNLTMLARLINEYTIHKARCIIIVGDYLNYDTDIVLVKDATTKIADPKAIKAAQDVVKKGDFFHIGRQPINFGDVKFENILNSKNCVIQYYGSYLRNNRPQIKNMHEQTGIKGISWVDATMLENAGPMFYHFPDMFDVDKVCPWHEISFSNILDSNTPIKIVHSPTNRAFKKTDLFLSIIDDLQKDYPIELILLEGLSNKECLVQKQQAHMLFDQISVGRFALSAIESMAMEQIVLCSVSNLVMSCYPDNPVVSVTEKTLKDVIVYFLENRSEILSIGKKGRMWVRQNCDPIKAVDQYIWLYDYIINGNRIVKFSQKSK